MATLGTFCEFLHDVSLSAAVQVAVTDVMCAAQLLMSNSSRALVPQQLAEARLPYVDVLPSQRTAECSTILWSVQ